MNRRLNVYLMAAGAAFGCAHAPAAGGVRPQSQRRAVVTSTRDLSSVRSAGRDGQLHVETSAGDSARAQVRLTGPDCRQADYELRASRTGSEWSLRVEPSTKDHCDEQWTLELPPALSVRGGFDRANVDVRGVAGGLDLTVGNGTVRASVPAGDLHLRVTKGDIIAATGRATFASVDVAAEVGRVEVRLNGGLMDHPRPPGPGDWLRLSGSGADRLSLRTTVGNVRLAIGGRGR